MSRKKRRRFYADRTVVFPVEENRKYRKNRRKTIKGFASSIFKETSVSVISNIILTRNLKRRLFKTAVVLGCLTGFLYQFTTYLQVVLKFPTTVDIDMERPSFFQVPAYTFCNNNGIKRSAFCEKFPERCYEPDEDFCDEYYPYCGKNRTKVPKKEFYSLEQKPDSDDLEDVQQNLDEFVVQNINYFIFGEVLQPTGPFYRSQDLSEGGLSACYRLQSLVLGQEGPYTTARNDFVKVPINTLKFRVDEDDVFIPGHRAGMLFSIHSPYKEVNPFDGGIFMKPGRKYKIHVNIEEEVLMAYPYDTDCISYREVWEKNNRTGLTTKDMCKEKCLFEAYMKCFNCTYPGNLYPHEENICKEDDGADGCEGEPVEEYESCLLTCKDDCWKTKYRYEVQERYNIQFDRNGEIMEDTRKFVSVEVYIDNEEIMILRHKPKYLGVEVFSSIGGFLGGWLGISLVGISDIVECLFQILCYSAKRFFST